MFTIAPPTTNSILSPHTEKIPIASTMAAVRKSHHVFRFNRF